MILSILTPFVPSKMANADEVVEKTNHIVRLSYEREDHKYDGWDVWVWNTGIKEDDIAFDNYDNDVATAFIEVADQTTKIGYKIRKGDEQNAWLEAEPGGDGIDREIPINRQDSITKVIVTQGEEDVSIVPGIPHPEIEDGHATFYYRDKDLYEQDQMEQIDQVSLNINDEILTMEYEQENERYVYEYENFPEGTFDYTFIVTKEGKEEKVKDPYFGESSIENNQVNLELSGSVSPNRINYMDKAPYAITFRERTVMADKGWRLIDELYSYDGDDLGVTLHEDGTATLKLWSPSADSVSVTLYDKGDQQDKVISNDIEMTLSDYGVWEVTLGEENTGLSDLTGYYYHYEIKHDGKKVLALDPYAKSMATWNSENTDNVPVGKAAIVDPSTIGPALDFADIEGYEKREDAIIYEVHVRDFTSDPNIAEDLTSEFGTFSAFIEKLDYLEDLGVTHIQLLPVMSYFFANEFDKEERLLEYSSTNNNYNWGYDPHSYFSLTGMYSEQPDDPEKRIEEFKLLVNEIHNRGMGVVLDVVYNHTARINLFEDLEPNYYHFMNADGTPRESFGGGRLGTTHEMARKVLVDSILYWVDEFKVDGFRFDMMGDHDAETIQIAFDQAKALNPDIVMIGEGWVTYAGDENGGDVMPADQQWMEHTQAVGSFSDDMRNELKSGFGSEGKPRFLTGGARNIEHIYDNVTANPHNFVADDPGDVVSYIAAHDNLTLHDVIAQSIKKDPKDHSEEIHQRIRLGNTMILTAQGTSFIHAGQEFGRTKQFMHDDYKGSVEEAPYKSTYMEDANGNPFEYPYFIHDSYDSTDAVNRIDWDKATNKEKYPINVQTREYTKGLIELRRSTDAFQLGTMDEIAENVSMIKAPEIKDEDLVIGYKAISSDELETYHVFVNADDEKRTLTLDENLTAGSVVVDSEKSGINEISNPTGVELTKGQIIIDPLTAVVVKMVDQSGEGDQPEDKDEPEEEGDKPGDKEDPKKDDQSVDKDNLGDEETPDKKSDQEKAEKDKDEELVTEESKDGKELPTTATNIFNYFIVGVLLLIGSLCILVYRRQVNKGIR